MLDIITRGIQLRSYHHARALEIKTQLETDPNLSKSERKGLKRQWKLHRRFWRHHAKVVKQQRQAIRELYQF